MSEEGPPRRTGHLPPIERSTLHLYQLYDIANSIDLERAHSTLASPSARMRPVVTRGASIAMPQMPLVATMSQPTLTLAGLDLAGRLEARIYDLGVLAFRLVLALPDGLSWEQAVALTAALQSGVGPALPLFDEALQRLKGALAPALEQPNEAIRTEDYTVLLIERLGPGGPAAGLGGHPTLLRAALGEHRQLSAQAATLATTLSYYQDDLIVLTWSGAVVVEPDPTAGEDVTFLLEVANVQLLAFRTNDAEAERELGRIVPRLAEVRRLRWLGGRSATNFLHEIHSLIVDTTEVSGRAGNALKVTEDVYWNRVYTAALGALRVDVWRAGLDQTLDVLRQTAGLLADEAEATRALLLEVLVIVLIAVEVVIALGIHL